MKPAKYWIEQLDLQPHPEGGYYREIYRASGEIPSNSLPRAYGGPRPYVTVIYFLLRSGDISVFHRLRSTEHWHYHMGSAATIHFLSPQGEYYKQVIGEDMQAGQQLVVTIPAGDWFAAEVKDPGSYILVSCTVAPGFDFADFEMATREQLTAKYPQQTDLITHFCHES